MQCKLTISILFNITFFSRCLSLMSQSREISKFVINPLLYLSLTYLSGNSTVTTECNVLSNPIKSFEYHFHILCLRKEEQKSLCQCKYLTYLYGSSRVIMKFKPKWKVPWCQCLTTMITKYKLKWNLYLRFKKTNYKVLFNKEKTAWNRMNDC